MNVSLHPFSQSAANPTNPNILLAEKIIEEARKTLDKPCRYGVTRPFEHVVEIVKSEGFKKDPIKHLILMMVKRGVGMAFVNDQARAFVIGRIPNFADRVSSYDYLRSIACSYLDDHEKMIHFDRSLEMELFQKDLIEAVEEFRRSLTNDDESELIRAEDALRVPLTIFYWAKKCKPYQHSEAQYLE